MKLFFNLIFVLLIVLTPKTMAQNTNELFIKIKLQQVTFLELLNDRRYIERKYVSKLKLMENDFDHKNLGDVKRLRTEYRNLLIFKDYFKRELTLNSVKNKINKIFEKNHTEDLRKWEEQLILKNISKEKIVTVQKPVMTKEKSQSFSFYLAVMGFILSAVAAVGVVLFVRLRLVQEELTAQQSKNRRIALVNMVLKKSKQRNFYIVKGNKVVYSYLESNLGRKYKRASEIEEDLLSEDEYSLVNESDSSYGKDHYFLTFKVSDYSVYDIVDVESKVSDQAVTSSPLAASA